MGVIGIAGKVIAFPFKLVLGRKKKADAEQATGYPSPETMDMKNPAAYPNPTDDNLKAKMDLMMSQIDSMRIEYDAINQRIQNIERMVKEIYTMAKS